MAMMLHFLICILIPTNQIIAQCTWKESAEQQFDILFVRVELITSGSIVIKTSQIQSAF